jgi:hypothetical protein
VPEGLKPEVASKREKDLSAAIRGILRTLFNLNQRSIVMAMPATNHEQIWYMNNPPFLKPALFIRAGFLPSRSQCYEIYYQQPRCDAVRLT